MIRIDYVIDSGEGDYAALYVNDCRNYEGHSIPDWIWVGLIEAVVLNRTGPLEFYQWEFDFRQTVRAPVTFGDLMHANGGEYNPPVPRG